MPYLVERHDTVPAVQKFLAAHPDVKRRLLIASDTIDTFDSVTWTGSSFSDTGDDWNAFRFRSTTHPSNDTTIRVAGY